MELFREQEISDSIGAWGLKYDWWEGAIVERRGKQNSEDILSRYIRKHSKTQTALTHSQYTHNHQNTNSVLDIVKYTQIIRAATVNIKEFD